MIIPRTALLFIGGNFEDMTRCVEHDLWMKMSKTRLEMDLVPQDLVYTTKHDHPIIRTYKKILLVLIYNSF
jgi:hypothetical protein|tara:strand:- start:2414 stop:2626 length:213 start_codon:yes stop_codon:yes gene_type:complete